MQSAVTDAIRGYRSRWVQPSELGFRALEILSLGREKLEVPFLIQKETNG